MAKTNFDIIHSKIGIRYFLYLMWEFVFSSYLKSIFRIHYKITFLRVINSVNTSKLIEEKRFSLCPDIGFIKK